MTFPTSTRVGRLYIESRHLPAIQGGGGDGVSEARDAAGRFFPLAQVTAEALGQARNAGIGAAGAVRALGALGALGARPDAAARRARHQPG